MKWTKPNYRREDINIAGKTLLEGIGDRARNNAFIIVNDWRAAHAFPLHSVYVTLKSRAQKVDRFAITAQRRKRLPSIIAKLKRENTMRLSQMADIGGCRAIVSTVNDVNDLVDLYKLAKAKSPRRADIRIRDYVAVPKADGYRSIHIIYKYKSNSSAHKVFNDLKIEIQIRSKLQHAWATAVEIVDAFTGQGLKSGIKLNLGDPQWRRFFVLMSAWMARRENCIAVAGTPEPAVLKQELRELSTKLDVENTLYALRQAVQLISKHDQVAVAYLVVLDLAKMELTAKPFSDQPTADESYLKTEKEFENDQKVFVLLASVESIKSFRTAYPNYTLDATEFLKALKRATK